MHAASPEKIKVVKESPARRSSSRLARLPRTGRIFFGGLRLRGPRHRPGRRRSPSRRSWAVMSSYVTGLALAGDDPDLRRLRRPPDLVGHRVAARRSARSRLTEVDSMRRATPDGTLVASVADDMVCRLWDVATGRLIHELRGHAEKTPHDFPSMLYACAFSPDGRLPGDRPTRSAISTSGTSNRGRESRHGRGPGDVHLGPGPAAPLDRRDPRAGLLARRDAARRRAASARSGTSTTWKARPRVEVFDWQKGERICEFPGEGQGPGRTPGVPPERRLAARRRRLQRRVPPASSISPPRKSWRKTRCRCTSTTSP